MPSDVRKLLDVASPGRDLEKAKKAFSDFAEFIVRKHEKNEREIERVTKEIASGSRAGKGRFHL